MKYLYHIKIFTPKGWIYKMETNSQLSYLTFKYFKLLMTRKYIKLTGIKDQKNRKILFYAILKLTESFCWITLKRIIQSIYHFILFYFILFLFFTLFLEHFWHLCYERENEILFFPHCKAFISILLYFIIVCHNA